MILKKINPELPLYSVSEVFSDSICNQLNAIDWQALGCYEQLDGNRVNLILPAKVDYELQQYATDILFPTIENHLKIKFASNNPIAVSYWKNTPGYCSKIHVDGWLPATMQVYWQSSHSQNYGTWFYNSFNEQDLMHYFPSVQNTGYLALHKTSKQPLWHGTSAPLPKNILRISFMFVLDDYTTL
jgi:hypothetical protein